jgi:diguanylate cyclase (GGDEF)-like protein
VGGIVASDIGPTVLVADDDQHVLDRFDQLLRSQGYEVVLATDGREALSRVRQHRPDLVMLDVLMPGLDGLEVCRILKSRQNAAFLPVIIITSKDDMESRVEGLRLGADDYLTKPPDSAELLARIEALLRIKKLQDRISKSTRMPQTDSVTDELTGLYNANYLGNRLEDEFKRAERYSEPLSCILVQLDNYPKVLNDYGRDTSFEIIRDLSGLLSGGVREFDVVVRSSETEFVILLPRTHFTGSLAVATRIWKRVKEHYFMHQDKRIPIAVSMGVSFFPNKDVSSAKNLIDQATQALGKARESGGSQICLYQHTTYFYRPDMGM